MCGKIRNLVSVVALSVFLFLQKLESQIRDIAYGTKQYKPLPSEVGRSLFVARVYSLQFTVSMCFILCFFFSFLSFFLSFYFYFYFFYRIPSMKKRTACWSWKEGKTCLRYTSARWEGETDRSAFSRLFSRSRLRLRLRSPSGIYCVTATIPVPKETRAYNLLMDTVAATTRFGLTTDYWSVDESLSNVNNSVNPAFHPSGVAW